MTVSLDLLDVDSLLTGEELDIRAAARRFADERLRPQLPEWFESASIPARDLAKELGSLGLLGMHLTGYGCAGVGPVAYGLACLEIEAADSGMRSLVSVQGSLAMYAIWKYGSEEQKTEWLPRMAAGEAIGGFGLTGVTAHFIAVATSKASPGLLDMVLIALVAGAMLTPFFCH